LSYRCVTNMSRNRFLLLWAMTAPGS